MTETVHVWTTVRAIPGSPNCFEVVINGTVAFTSTATSAPGTASTSAAKTAAAAASTPRDVGGVRKLLVAVLGVLAVMLLL